MGEALLKTVVNLTGLPEDPITQELEQLIEKAGIKKAELTLDDMRDILAEYLQDTLLELKDTYEGQV